MGCYYAQGVYSQSTDNPNRMIEELWQDIKNWSEDIFLIRSGIIPLLLFCVALLFVLYYRNVWVMTAIIMISLVVLWIIGGMILDERDQDIREKFS